jgi:hypothetical protein
MFRGAGSSLGLGKAAIWSMAIAVKQRGRLLMAPVDPFIALRKGENALAVPARCLMIGEIIHTVDLKNRVYRTTNGTCAIVLGRYFFLLRTLDRRWVKDRGRCGLLTCAIS